MIATDFNHKLLRFTFFRGRVALYAILKALGIGEGDEVIIQAFTCVAVPEAIMATGARPIYVDINLDSYNMAPKDLSSKINFRTRAIIIQHTFGIPADLESLISIAKNNGIPIIEDCAHSISSKYCGKLLGNFGVASFYSYEWGKPIVIGIGGSAVYNDDLLLEIASRQYNDYVFPPKKSDVRINLQYIAYRFTYQPRFYWKIKKLYHAFSHIGLAQSNYNPIHKDSTSIDFLLKLSISLRSRLSNKLKETINITKRSLDISSQYSTKIESPLLSHPIISSKCFPVFARYPLLTTDFEYKSYLLSKARQKNIELADWYNTPVHPLSEREWIKVYYEQGSCPIAEKRCSQIITLPTHQLVSNKDIENTVNFFNQYK